MNINPSDYFDNKIYQNMLQLKSNMNSIQSNMDLICQNISNNYVKVKFYFVDKLDSYESDITHIFDAMFEKNITFNGAPSHKATLYNQPYMYVLSRFYIKNIHFPFFVFDMKTKKELQTDNICFETDMELCLSPKQQFFYKLYSHEDSIHFYKSNFVQNDF